MKKVIFIAAAAGLMSLAACTPAANNTAEPANEANAVEYDATATNDVDANAVVVDANAAAPADANATAPANAM